MPRRRLPSAIRALLALCLLIGGLLGLRSPATASPAAAPTIIPGRLIEVRAGDAVTAAPIRARLRPNAPRTATINVTYNGFTPESQAAFQAAVDIWSASITSTVPIEVVANWTQLGPGVLGSAGPSLFIRDWTAGTPPPRAATWYPIALANKLAGVDLSTQTHDINANFSSVFANWYFGTDGATPAGQYDFMSVVLHELGHGLGFVGSASVNSGNGSWGQGSGFPFVYDRFTENGAGAAIINTGAFPNPSAALAAQLQGADLFFDGPQAAASNGGSRPKLYAPGTWIQGSSYSHLDEATFPAGNPNALMTPQIGTAEAIHYIGPVTVGMFRDMGWEIDAPEPPASADLALTQAVTPAVILPGRLITYTLTLRNNGAVNAENVAVRDPIPAAITVERAIGSSGWTCVISTSGNSTVVDCHHSSLPPGEATLTIQGRVDGAAPAGTVLSNTATVSAQTADPDSGNNAATLQRTVGSVVYAPIIEDARPPSPAR